MNIYNILQFISNKKILKFIILFIFLYFSLPFESYAQVPCGDVSLRSTGGAVINEPGEYCLASDMLVDSRYTPFSHGASVRGKDHILLFLMANNISIDLKNHTIVGNAPLRAGIETPSKDFQNYHEVPELILPNNLTIRNGSIKLTKRASSGIGILIVSDPDLPVSIASDFVGIWQAQQGEFQSSASIADAKKWADKIRNNLSVDPSEFSQRHILIENMTIRTKNSSIAIQGAGTIIRNCIIETDAGTAIWIYGPNVIIENNQIIVHADDVLLEADAPIRLHHGDGAIIRNNTIVIKGGANKRGLSLFDTGPVTVENNSFFGITEKDEVVKYFSGQPDATLNKNSFLPGWRFYLK